MLPGPAVNIAVEHDFFLAIAGYPFHPGLDHAEEQPPDDWYIANVLLEDFFGLRVDLQALVPVEFLTTFFEPGIKLGVGPGLAPATGEF